MKRVLICLSAAVPLLGGVAVAEAANTGPRQDTQSVTTTSTDAQATVVGTIVSVDATAGTFVAKAFVVPPFDPGHKFGGGFGPTPGGSSQPGGGSEPGGFGPGSGGFGSGPGGFGPGRPTTTGTTTTSTTSSVPTPSTRPSSMNRSMQTSTVPTGTQTGPVTSPTAPAPSTVTITTSSSTTITVGHTKGTVGDLAAGDHFRAVFSGSPTESISTVTAAPAESVDAGPAPMEQAIYAFVGTVASEDAAAGTVTVDVSNSVPSALLTAGKDATFTVSKSTLVLGGSSGMGFSDGSLSSLSVGDTVAGGLLGSAGLTAAQFEADPLMVLLDLPATSSSTSTSSSSSSAERVAKARELRRMEDLLGPAGKTKTKTKSTKGSHHHKH